MKKEERAALVSELKAKIAAFTDEMLGGSYTEKLSDPQRNYPSPKGRPAEIAHPRVMLSAEMLPAIREAMHEPENAAGKWRLTKL